MICIKNIRDLSGNPFAFRKKLKRKARPKGECHNNHLNFFCLKSPSNVSEM